jgi:undecaprenyl-diphosphatase
MSSRALRRRRSLAPLAAVTAAALIFAVLLVLVRLRWAPLESADHGAAAGINGLIAGNATLVAVVKAVTWLGSDGVLWTVVGAAAVVLALRRQWRLAVYLLVTGAGALVWTRSLNRWSAGCARWWRTRSPTASGTASPAGTALGSIVCYGAVLLVFLPRPGAGGAPRSSP